MSALTEDTVPKQIKGRPTGAAPPPPPPPEDRAYVGSPAADQNPLASALTGGAIPGSTAIVAPMGLYGEVEPAFMPGFVRKPFGTMDQKLAYAERPNYHRHWFNDPPDKPGRIEEAYNAGYTHVRDKSNRPVVRTVGRGGLKAYLMECPAHMWAADMAAQERVNQKIEAAIRGGKVSRNPDDDDIRYIPKGAIRFEDE